MAENPEWLLNYLYIKMALSKRQKNLNRLSQARRNARSSMQTSLSAAPSNQENAAHSEDPVPESATTPRLTKEKRRLDITEHNDPIDLSAKRQVVSQDHSMPQIVHTLPSLAAYFDDSDVPCTLDSDDSDDSICPDDFDNFFDDISDASDEGPDNGDNNEVGVKTTALEWCPNAEESLRGPYGSGSRATLYRQRQRQDSLQREASKSYSIMELFKRQAAQKTDEAGKVVPLSKIGRGKPGPTAEEDARSKASSDLKRLVEHSTEQTKKYGHELSKDSDFFKRHIMLLSFLWIRQKRENFPGVNLRDLARMVATNHNKGTGYARHLVIWEKSWTAHRVIPQRKSRKSSADVSWMNEEDIACATRDFVKTQGDSKLSFFFVEGSGSYIS